MTQEMLGIRPLAPLPFLNSTWTSVQVELNINSKFLVHVPLKPSLENFEHYFASVWDECNCAVVWTFFDITFLWRWNESWPFPVLWPLLSFTNLLVYWGSTFTASSFMIWNNSAGISSPALALFIVMLPKAHLTLHSRIFGSRWVITVSWLSGSLRFFCVYSYFCPLYLMLIKRNLSTQRICYVIRKL